jgi:hypothetical protein
VPDLVCQTTSVVLDFHIPVIIAALVLDALVILGGALIIRRRQDA